MFAHYLDAAAEVLDLQGGTSIVQTVPSAVHITQGSDQLRCVVLKPAGLLRWYAACCRTPIGNTLASYKMHFVGLVQACLVPEKGTTLDEAFGPLVANVNTGSAKGEPRPRASSPLPMVAKFLAGVVRARVNGSYQNTPFFSADGIPVATPEILDEAVFRQLRELI